MALLPAEYDAIARAYQRTKASPLRLAIETHTLQALLGDCRGRAIFDAGCGEGFYARRLRAAGASRVVGVDASSAMIALAREEEQARPLGIQYACCPVEDLPALFCTGAYDTVLAAYLLHYAARVPVLAAMCQRLADALAPGGRLVALTENPDQSVAAYQGYTPFGFDKRALAPRAEGSRIGYGLIAGREILRFETFWYSRATYRTVLEAAGFDQIEWHPLAVDPAVDGTPYAPYLENPPVLGLTARKAQGSAGP